jgi:hypothetical protein
MYELSRALYRELRPLLAVDRRCPGRVERLLLEACEQTVEGIAGGLNYFPTPAAHLFADVRFLFPVREQARARAIIGGRVAKAQESLSELQAIEGMNGRRRCLALTAQGAPCRREAQHNSRYCSSHRHMEGDGDGSLVRRRSARFARQRSMTPG